MTKSRVLTDEYKTLIYQMLIMLMTISRHSKHDNVDAILKRAKHVYQLYYILDRGYYTEGDKDFLNKLRGIYINFKNVIDKLE